jgi:hypothetical protein
MSSALKADGKLVIDYLNINTVIKQLVPSESRTIDGIHFQISRKVANGYLIKEITIEDPARSNKMIFSEKVATFGLGDFKHLLQQEGLVIREALGDYALTPFDLENSPRLILICEKN